VPTPTVVTPPSALAGHRRPVTALGSAGQLRIVPWLDPIADPHGVHPCSRYVELYWLGVIGPSTTSKGPVGMMPCRENMELTGSEDGED